MKKKARTIFGILLLLFTLTFNSMAIQKLSEETRIEEIARGVLFKEQRLQTESGWVDIFILEVDLSQEGIKIDAISSSNGLSSPQTMSAMARESGAIAAVNADFFMMSSTGVPIGSQVRDGELIKSPQPGLSGWTHFAIDIDNTADFIRPVFLTNLTFADGSRRSVEGLNCEVDFTWSRIVVYNEYFGRTSPGRFGIMAKNAKDYTEIIVDGNNKVVDVRENLGGVMIPSGGFVIAGSNDEATFLREKVKIGDEIFFRSYADPSLDTLSAMLGGQPYLVDGGELVPIGSSDIAGINPRTAVGISEDGKTVWLVVVDGRSSRSRGFTFKELAEYFRDEIGAYKALNLDGGGSSAMVVKRPGTEYLSVVNRPSDGSERRVPNGLGVFIDVKDDEAYNVALQLEVDGKFSSFPTEIINIPQRVNQGIKAIVYRADGSVIENAKVSYTVEPALAHIEYGFIKPISEGYATITARVAGTDIETSQKIHILDELALIEIEPGSIATSVGQNVPLRVKATDVNGFSVYLNPADVKWEVRNDIGSIKDGVFYAENDMAAGVIVAQFESLKNGAAVVVGSQVILLSDFENSREWTFSTYPAEVTGKLEFTDEQVYSGSYAAKLTYDFTQTTKTRAAYVNLVNNKLPGRPLKLGLWIYGDGNGHWFRGELSDANGVKKVVDFAMNVDWHGWRYVTAEIPQDIDFPVQLRRIYLVEAKPDLLKKGAIYLDRLEVVLPQEIPSHLLEGFETEIRDPHNRVSEPADPKKANEFRFVVFGDSKVIAGSPNSLGNIILSRSIAMINQEKDIDFVIYTGDLIEHDTDENYKAGLEAIKPLNAPFKMVIANHEIAKSNNYKNYEKYFGDTYYSFTHKNSHFIVLNSARGGLTVSDPKQWGWLREELEKATQLNVDNVFLAMHIPTYDPNPGSNTGFNIAEAEQLEKLLGDYKRETGKNVWLFHGHVHGFARRIRDGVQYIDSAGSGSELYLPPKFGGFYHYVVVDVKGDEITYQVYPLIDKIIIDNSLVADLKVGDEVQIKAEALGPRSVRFPLKYPAQAIWSSSNSDVGSIDNDGNFLALKSGVTKITVSSGIYSESIDVIVK